MWKEGIEHDFGDIQSRRSYKHVFTYEGDKEIKYVTSPGCTCTTARRNDNEVEIILQPSPVAPATKEAGIDSYLTRRIIKVHYKDGTFDTLVVKGRVYDSLDAEVV